MITQSEKSGVWIARQSGEFASDADLEEGNAKCGDEGHEAAPVLYGDSNEGEQQ